MASITLHNLDETLYKTIKQKAKLAGTSLNKTIKEILTNALGLSDSKTQQLLKKEALMDLFGVWSDTEYKKFIENLKDFSVIDKQEWS